MVQEVSRRTFLKVFGAGGVALAGCSSPLPKELISELMPAEEIIPGVATWYASTCRECPAGCGVRVRTREGRAVKVEGNAIHPVNRGGLCARGQASLQGLYNPDRIRQPLKRSASGSFDQITWEEGEALLAARLGKLREEGKASGVVFLTPPLTGSLDLLIDRWLNALGSHRRLRYEPFGYEPLRAANRIAFGRSTIPTYDIAGARLLLSFGADFLETWISPVSYSAAFSAMRAYRQGEMGKFIHVDPRLSLTAASADEWIPVKPGTEALLALGMIHVILSEGLDVLSGEERESVRLLVGSYSSEAVAAQTEVPAKTVRRLARAFAEIRPSLALGGGTATGGPQATTAMVAVNLLNHVVGNVGQTVRFAPTASFDHLARYEEMIGLIQTMDRGEVPLLLFSSVNPLFTIPPSAGFRQALAKVPWVVSFSSFLDETTAEADLILPDHSPLESWGDYIPWKGVHGLVQPAMSPLFETRALGDVLLSLARQIGGEMTQALPWGWFIRFLAEEWKHLHSRVAPDTEFTTFWEEALRRGGVWEPVGAEPVRLNPELFRIAFEESTFDGEGPFYLLPYPSLTHFDGRGSNRPWLQEVPDPMAQLTWDSWVEIHPDTASSLGIVEGDLVQLISPSGQIELPAHLTVGLRQDVVAVPVGQGHISYGRYAKERGANPITLLPARAEALSGGLRWSSTRVSIIRTGQRHRMASVEGHPSQLGRGIAQAIPLAEANKLGPLDEEEGERRLRPRHPHTEHRWGMAIDLNACTGCNACVVACYAENNLAVVGKEGVIQGREMSWIRIERYVEGPPEQPDIRFLPMLCQHCDKAPCEPVCPVYATYHNPEGLNAQIYNRCVGTRYCSNNCPYKVRRFNWFTYQWPKPFHLQLNPDVTVREKGVMEKCTFCVQRIREGKDQAKDEGRPVRDGEIVPACAQSCPTKAIVFGDLRDLQSEVSRLHRDPRRYRVMEELNTEPAITYLKKIRPGQPGK
ncbi:MAG: molybdopterin-dependent oxidoreductase [Candidatus Binatia bacterium]